MMKRKYHWYSAFYFLAMTVMDISENILDELRTLWPRLTDDQKNALRVVVDCAKEKSLREARCELLDGLDDGIVCGCCGQYAKRYKRKLNSAMAYGLIWLVKASGDLFRWVNIHESPLIQGRRVGGDFAKLEHWHLIEAKPNNNDAKRCSGIWKPTNKGRNFVYDEIVVPSYVVLYHNQIYGWSNDRIKIREALGTKFNYDELMNL